MNCELKTGGQGEISISAVEPTVCYGCGSCASACNNDAISMEVDRRGFVQPVIDDKKCKHCGLCVEVCPVLNQGLLKGLQSLNPFALQTKNSVIRMMSSSGGAAQAISLAFGNRGYSIIGAVFTDDFRYVNHIIAQTPEEIMLTAGSEHDCNCL